MTLFSKWTFLTVGLLAATTTVGVYGAMAGSSASLQRPAIRQQQVRPQPYQAEPKRVIRIVGPTFLPDNGDIKLLGAAEERARRS